MQAAALAAVLLALVQLPWISRAEDGQRSMRGHLEAFGRQGPSLSIDAVDGFIPPNEFVEKYVLQNRPLLFRGAARESPAFTKWTDEYFQASTPPRPAGDVFIEHKKKENRSQTYSYVHFNKFLEMYNSSDIYMVSDVPEKLLADLVLPFPLQCKFFLQGGLDTHVVWFSSGGTSSVIHNDAYENINCLYRGRKTLVFLNTTKYREEVGKIIDRVDGAFSSVDVDRIDLIARPEFRDLEFHLAEMNAGDCLYIPLYWVHQVRSYDNNLAVNIWWPPRNQYPLGMCSPKYSKNLNFAKVYFRTLEENARTDVEHVRLILEANLPDDRTEAALLTLLSGGNPEVLANKDFAVAVSAIFKALDINMDGSLSTEELKLIRLKRKQYHPARRAISDYNVLVFGMHEFASAEAAARLPKLFSTSGSDESVFAPHRTWKMVEPPPTEVDDMDDTDTLALTGNDPSEQSNSVPADANVGEKKDEL